MPTNETDVANSVIFVLAKDAMEREAMRAALAEAGLLVIALESINAAIALFDNRAVCDALVVSTDVLEKHPEQIDRLIAAKTPSPAIIVYGVDPLAKAVLYCLNKGAVDFLAKPFEPDDLVRAVERAVRRDSDKIGEKPKVDSIVGIRPVADWLEITASSELEQFRRIQRFSDALFASLLPAQVVEDLKMAIEEVGRNAVEWGNRFDPDKRVRVSYCLFDDRIVIKVQDEGEGFIPQDIPDPTANPLKTMRDRIEAGKRPGGYGVYLIQKLVDDIVYSEKGNVVLLIKYLPEPGQAEKKQ